jgi:hypothetical protein
MGLGTGGYWRRRPRIARAINRVSVDWEVGGVHGGVVD